MPQNTPHIAGAAPEDAMNYGMPYATRRPATQVWAVGETVKVGFLTLRIVGTTSHGWKLTNRDASKHYEFEPHCGLRAL